MKLNLSKLFLSFLFVFTAAAIGSLSTYSEIPTWYASLQKPSFNPPNWIFGPVWTTLYIFMAISFYLVWTKKNKKKVMGMKYFLAQLGLNSLWSLVFFGMHNPLLALIVIVLLWAFIFLTIKEFRKIDKLASNLLVPYILWVSFASVLNAAIVVLN